MTSRGEVRSQPALTKQYHVGFLGIHCHPLRQLLEHGEYHLLFFTFITKSECRSDHLECIAESCEGEFVKTFRLCRSCAASVQLFRHLEHTLACAPLQDRYRLTTLLVFNFTSTLSNITARVGLKSYTMAFEHPLPAVDQLSGELLVMIVEQVKDHYRGGVEDLENMRLVASCFAHLGKLLSYLFNAIRFEANPDRADALASMDWTTIAPHVQCVIFDPGKYSWAMTWKVFAHIVKKRTLRNHLPFICSDGGNGLSELLLASVEPSFDTDSLVDEADLQKCYEHYVAGAENVRRLYESGRFQAVWTQCLRSFTHATDFLFG